MLSLPQEYELIGLFESEPRLSSPDVPWCYNNLHFSIRRNSDYVVCEITPAYGEVKINWQQNDQHKASIKLNNLENLSVHIAKNDEYMVLSGAKNSPLTLFKLRLKPFVSVELECWHETS